MSRLRKLWPALALMVLTLIPLWRCVLGGQTIGAWDEVRQLAPWHGQASTPWDVLQADSVLQFYGWRSLVFTAWSRGHLPLWNNLELNGTPLLANSQSGAFYPPHILAGLAHMPTGPAMALLAWFHLLWAGIGVYLLCRHLGGSPLAALLGASGFAVSPFMIGWIGLPSVVETAAWIPWVLLGAYRLPQIRAFALTAASTAMMLLAGHLQFAAYGLIAAVCVLVVRGVQGKAWKTVLGAGMLAVVSGTLIAGPQLFPVLAFGQHSHRRQAATSEGYAAYNAGALPVWELFSLPDSGLLGYPTDSISVGRGAVNGFWPALVQRGGNFAESAISVGPVVLLLLVVGFRKKMVSSHLSVGLTGAVGLLLAIGTPLGALLYFLAPGWSATGSPGRAGVLLVLALCVIAGSTDLEMIAGDVKSSRARLIGFAGFVLLCLAGLFLLPLSSWIPNLSEADLRSVIPHSDLALRTLGITAAVIALGFIAIRMPRLRTPVGMVLALIIATIPGPRLVRSSDTLLEPVSSSAGRIAVVNGDWELLETPKALLPPNTGAMLGIHEAGGYDSIVDVRTRDMLRDVDGEDPAPAANGNMMFVKRRFDPAKLAELGVTEVWSLSPLPQLGSEPEPIDGVYHYRLAGPGRVSMSNGSATLMRETAEYIDFEATGPGVMTVRDHLREGWTVRVDDELTGMDVDPWPRVVLPRGRHSIRFQYWPPGLTSGFQALAAGLAIIALYVFTSRRSPQGKKRPVVQ